MSAHMWDREDAVFEINLEDQGTTRTISPRGELDLQVADDVQTALLTAVSDGFENVVLDLAATTFLDSSGIQVIVRVYRRAQERRTRFVVLPGPPAVQRTLELSGVTDALPLVQARPGPNGGPG